MAETRILPVSAGRDFARQSCAKSRKRNCQSGRAAVNKQGQLADFCLSFAILASFPATAAGKICWLPHPEKTADIWRATMAGARKTGIARLAGKFFQAWQKGGLRFCPAKSARKLMPSGRLGLFFSLPKTPGRKRRFRGRKNCAAQGKRQACRLYLPQFHTFPGK